MGKKKAIKLATATAIAASAFVAVAPTQSEAATSSVDKAITKASSAMLKAFNTYNKTAREDQKLPALSTIKKDVKAAQDAYTAATKEIASKGGTKAQKAKLTTKLNANKKYLDRAELYLKAVTTNLHPTKNAFTEAVKGGTQSKVLSAQKAYQAKITEFEANVKKVYGPDARNLLTAKYADAANELVNSVNEEMKVYEAYKKISGLVATDLEAAYKGIQIVEKEAANVAKSDSKLAKNITNAVVKINAKFEKAVQDAVSIEGITDGEKTEEETKTITVKATKGSEIEVTLNGTAVAANENGTYTLKLQEGSNKVAVSSTVYGVKTELSKEITSNQTPAVKSVSAINAKTLEVKFSKAVDNSKAKFDLTKDGFKSNYSSITWNADKTVATIELSSKITKGEYSVSVTGLTDKALTSSVKTEDEKVSGIEILSDAAPAASGNATAKIGYQITNQYGEDITKLNASSLTVTAAGATSATANADGSITINANGTFKVGDKVVLTLIHGATATTTTKTVTISQTAVASDVKFGDVYNKDGKTLNEDINLSKDKFYLPVSVQDQYGKEITDLSRLNGSGAEVLVTNTNPAVSTFGEFEKQTINGKDVVVLPVTNIVGAGQTNVIVIAKSSGKNGQVTVNVAEGLRTDTVTLGAPTKVVTAGTDILFPLSVLDKQGNVIKDAKAVEEGTTITGGDFYEKDGELYAKVASRNVTENSPVTVVVTTSTGKVATQTVIPKAATAPKVITGLDSKLSTAIREGSSTPITIAAKDLVVEDQYGQVIPEDQLRAKLSGHKIKAFVDADAPFTVAGEITEDGTNAITVTYKAGETKTAANVTFKLVKTSDSSEIEASAYSKQFSVVKDSSFASYKVEDIAPIYVAKAGEKWSIPTNYDNDIVVKATTGTGGEVTLDAGTDYTVKSTTLTGVNDGNVASADAADITFSGTATTTTAKVTITINATGEEIVKDVTFSNVAPKVEKVVVVENDKGAAYVSGDKTVKEVTVKDFNPAQASAFNLVNVYGLADIVASDQYGVMSTVAESGGNVGKASFNSVTTAAATLTLIKVSGDLAFNANGTNTASVDEISENGVFNARVNLAGVSATPVKVTAKKAYSSKAAADAADVSAAKTAVEGADYTAVGQSVVNTEAAAKEAVKAIIDAEELEGASYEIVNAAFTAAIAGTSDSTTGTAGSYKFKVKLTKGSATQTTSELTLPITATAYVAQ